MWEPAFMSFYNKWWCGYEKINVQIADRPFTSLTSCRFKAQVTKTLKTFFLMKVAPGARIRVPFSWLDQRVIMDSAISSLNTIINLTQTQQTQRQFISLDRNPPTHSPPRALRRSISCFSVRSLPPFNLPFSLVLMILMICLWMVIFWVFHFILC